MEAEIRKRMPQEVINELSQVERIQAHIQDNYELLSEDESYYQVLEKVFILVFKKSYRRQATTTVRSYFPEYNPVELLDHTITVFGDFFEVNKQAKRYLQEQRHLRIYNKCMEQKEYFTAEAALSSIDKLYGLYDTSDMGQEIGELPGPLKRSSNPALLSK